MKLSALLLALALPACPHNAIVIDPPLDAAPPPSVVASCQSACDRIAALCGSLGPNCPPACVRDQTAKGGLASELDVGCVLDAGTAQAMAGCRVPCGDAGVR